MQMPYIRASSSFCEAMSTDALSPIVGDVSKLKTPRLPPEAPPRPSKFSSSGGPSCHSCASGNDSELSGAATFNRSMRHLPLSCAVDSPAPPPKREEALSERRVPSCPQKEGGKVHKRHPTVAPLPDDTEEIKPRALDMNDADPVNGISLSPMNVSSPAPGPQEQSVDLAPRSLLEPFDARHKRPRISGLDASERSDVKRSNSIPQPPALRHTNSMADTKMLFTRQDSEVEFKFEDHFEWLRRLGSGSFSDVYAVRHKRKGEFFAIKRSKRAFHSRKERAEYLREVELANKMPAHPNVVEYYRAWQDSYFFYIQMELCDNGTLRQLMQLEQAALSSAAGEPRVWEMVRHIARGLAHIHSYQVLHCDLKPDNILISSDGSFKIGDLGQAIALKFWDEHEGDACYLSRDLLESNPSTAADIFSFGIMLYEIRSGVELPGSGEHWEFLRRGKVPPPHACGAELATLIQRSMAPVPEARPTAEEILQICCTAAAAAAMAAALAAFGPA